MTEKTLFISNTKKWLREVIIKLNFCPFARKEFVKESIHYEVVFSNKLEKYLEAFILECKRLDEQTEIETTLLIFPSDNNNDSFGLINFENYLTLVSLAEQFIIDNNYEGIYQVASFHPHYLFEGTDEKDPSNYTNRSPYPILHILRETSLEKALDNYKNPEEIPSKNIELANKMGLEKMKNLLSNCLK